MRHTEDQFTQASRMAG